MQIKVFESNIFAPVWQPFNTNRDLSWKVFFSDIFPKTVFAPPKRHVQENFTNRKRDPQTYFLLSFQNLLTKKYPYIQNRKKNCSQHLSDHHLSKINDKFATENIFYRKFFSIKFAIFRFESFFLFNYKFTNKYSYDFRLKSPNSARKSKFRFENWISVEKLEFRLKDSNWARKSKFRLMNSN